MLAWAEEEANGLLSQVFLAALYCLAFYSLTFLTVLSYFMAKPDLCDRPLSLLFQGLHPCPPPHPLLKDVTRPLLPQYLSHPLRSLER